jgi:glycosyltransferase involved in cell wall biosynthesis
MSETPPAAQRPVISVVLDGYNETRSLGTTKNTIEALKRQSFALEKVELIIAAGTEQITELKRIYGSPAPFGEIKYVVVEDGVYYQLKNAGAQVATGEIIAFTDSDVYPQPEWLASIQENIGKGFEGSVGLSLFKGSRGWEPGNALRDIAVSITFGYILGRANVRQLPELRGFMDHNLALRAAAYRRYPYREDQGRVCASPLLFRALERHGVALSLHPKQQVVHYFSWLYWVALHFRYGYEVYQVRRLDPHYPNQWIARTGPLEGVVTFVWHVLLNQPRWLRFSKLRGYRLLSRIALLPAVVVLSLVANGAEMCGIYATMLRPVGMRRWAEAF